MRIIAFAMECAYPDAFFTPSTLTFAKLTVYFLHVLLLLEKSLDRSFQTLLQEDLVPEAILSK